MKVCRICLSKDGRLYPITSNDLCSLYHQLTGVPKLEMEVDKRLPQWVCAECGLRLLSYNKLRQKSFRSHQILTNLLESVTHITEEVLNEIDRETNNLKSDLSYALVSNMTTQKYVADIQETNDTSWEPQIKIEDFVVNLEVSQIKSEDKYPEIHLEPAVSDNGTNSDGASNIHNDDDLSSESSSSVKKFIKTLSSKNLKTEHKNVLSYIKDEVDKYVSSMNKRPTKKVKRTTKKIKKEAVKKEPKRRVKKEMALKKPRVASTDDVFTVEILSLEDQKLELEKRKYLRTYINAPFKCHYCFRGFANKNVLAKHNLGHTDKCGKHECKICKRRFKNLQSYSLHSRCHRTVYICKMCNFRTNSRLKVLLHHRSKHKPKSYKCPHCYEEFNGTSTYWLHLRVKHASDSVCEYCGLPFLSARGLVLHKNLKHVLDMQNQVVSPDGPSCATCNITFVTDEALKTHKRVAHKIKDAHTGNKIRKRQSLICELCGLQTSGATAYKRHFRSHHPIERPTQVPIQPFMCDQCGACFEKKFNLFQHSVVHMQQTPYECDHCNKRFKSKYYLRTHIVSVHLPKTLKAFPCDICGREFSEDKNRQRHMVTVHVQARSFNCEICGTSFKSNAQVRAHAKHVHMKVPWPRKNKKDIFQHAYF